MAGIPGGEPPILGSRLHGNDGRRRRTPQSSSPPRREIHGGAPAMGSRLHGNDDGAAHPTIVIPTTAGIHGSHIVIPTTAGIHGSHISHIVIPATAGIHGGGPAMGSRLHGNDGRRRRTPQSTFPRRRAAAHPQSSFPRRRESTAGGGRRWVPVSTGTTDGDGAPHNRHSHNSGNPRQPHRHSRDGGGPAMGSRLHGNDGRRRRHSPARRGSRDPGAHPTIVIPATAGGRRWVPACAGTTGGATALDSPHNRHSHNAGIHPRHGAPSRLLKQSVTPSFPVSW